jgi:hypothetical protein
MKRIDYHLQNSFAHAEQPALLTHVTIHVLILPTLKVGRSLRGGGRTILMLLKVGDTN